MVVRKAISAALLGAALAVGGFAGSAQATELGASGISEQASSVVSNSPQGAAVYQWVYSGLYPSRSACDAAANRMLNDYNIRGQCRGPYAGGEFELWLWLNR